MKLNTLYNDISPHLLPPGLKRYHDSIVESSKGSVRRSYMVCITESRPIPGLFWIVPDVEGWTMLFWPDDDTRDHQSLWVDVSKIVADRIAAKEADLAKFGELFDAYPRGRTDHVHSVELTIGFGGDYPQGWDESKLKRELKLKPDTTIEIDDHWTHSKESRILANRLLGRND
jgi:hypothetical protein